MYAALEGDDSQKRKGFERFERQEIKRRRSASQ
jgi:hypothetical protein